VLLVIDRSVRRPLRCRASLECLRVCDVVILFAHISLWLEWMKRMSAPHMRHSNLRHSVRTLSKAKCLYCVLYASIVTTPFCSPFAFVFDFVWIGTGRGGSKAGRATTPVTGAPSDATAAAASAGKPSTPAPPKSSKGKDKEAAARRTRGSKKQDGDDSSIAGDTGSVFADADITDTNTAGAGSAMEVSSFSRSFRAVLRVRGHRSIVLLGDI